MALWTRAWRYRRRWAHALLRTAAEQSWGGFTLLEAYGTRLSRLSQLAQFGSNRSAFAKKGGNDEEARACWRAKVC
eukprot:999936-Prymnesium_polylepis.3